MFIFYDYNRVVCGRSDIMYHGKWYRCLYACESYVIIYYRGKYTKLDKYEVEDTEYNTNVIDEDGMVRRPNNSELTQMIEDGRHVLLSEYDIDAINACKEDMELIKTYNLKLYFLSGNLVKVENNSDDVELFNRFRLMICAISELPIGETRRGLNIIFIESVDSHSYNLVNMLLRKYKIYTDKEAIRCLDYRFIQDLVFILEGEDDYE